jgi:hypothetical protein
VAAHPGGEAARAGARFARLDHPDAAAQFVGQGLFLGAVPLAQRRQPIGAQAVLRKTGDLARQRDGRLARLPAVSLSTALRQWGRLIETMVMLPSRSISTVSSVLMNQPPVGSRMVLQV